jgi:AbrB family looped-hinge helix DNA binding protein
LFEEKTLLASGSGLRDDGRATITCSRGEEAMKGRIRIAADGRILLPREVTERLGWTSGSYLEVRVEGETVKLNRVEVDPFEEALKKPAPDALEKALERQQESQSQAMKDFEEKMKKPPEVRPEDRPDFWR